MIKTLVLPFLTSVFLISFAFSQNQNSLAYSLVNYKIESDSLFDFKLNSKPLVLSSEDISVIGDSSNLQHVVIVDSNKSIIRELDWWYADSTFEGPIQLDSSLINQLKENKLQKKWKKNKLSDKLSSTSKKNNKLFALSRPIFLNSGYAIIFCHLHVYYADRFFMELYHFDSNKRWKRVYRRLLWL